MSATQYDDIADAYVRSNQFDMRSCIEYHVLQRALGPVAGLDVLDLACGHGLYTRMHKEAGARRVVGVDSSAEMVRLAADQEAKHPLGIEYQVLSVADLPVLHPFDAATAVYLFHYAQTREQLGRMCEGIHRNLRPGGRLATVVTICDVDFLAAGGNYTKYGFSKHARSPLHDGDPFSLEFHMDPPFTVQVFQWGKATCEEALRKAGFREIAFFPLAPSEEAIQRFGAGFWVDYQKHPSAYTITCLA